MRHQKGERGQGLVEYALLIALVAIIAVAALSMMGRSLHTIPLREASMPSSTGSLKPCSSGASGQRRDLS